MANGVSTRLTDIAFESLYLEDQESDESQLTTTAPEDQLLAALLDRRLGASI